MTRGFCLRGKHTCLNLWSRNFKANEDTAEGRCLVNIIGLDFWQETDFLDCMSSEVHCSQLCLCSRRTFDIESDQTLCDNSLGNQGDDVLGPWDFLRWSNSNCQDNKRATMPEKKKNPFPPFLWVLMGDWMNKKKRQGIQWKEKRLGKMRAFPPFSEYFPCIGLSVGGLGRCSVLFGFILATQFSAKLFNCWQGMRHDYFGFNVKNHFHFSRPTIESFIFFFVNDTLHYTSLYDLLWTAERTPQFLQIPTIPSFFPPRVFTALESKGPCLISQVQHYFIGVEVTSVLQLFCIISSMCIEKRCLSGASFIMRSGTHQRPDGKINPASRA